MPSSTASSTPRTALPSTARPCANHRKTPASAENLTTTPPSEPLKWSTGAAVRDHRNAVRDRSERCPQSIGITVRFRRNPHPIGIPFNQALNGQPDPAAVLSRYYPFRHPCPDLPAADD